MPAATCIASHNYQTKTITYTFSAAVHYNLVADPYTEVAASAITAGMFAFYKTAFSATYAAPAGGNVYTGIVISTISFNAAGTILTVVYTGTPAAILLSAFGYICYPILYLANVADHTDSSANNIQAVVGTPTICPICTLTNFNTEGALATALAFNNGGAIYTPTKADKRCLLIFQNTDGSNAEAVTIYKGDGQQGVVDRTLSIPLSSSEVIVLESGMYKFFKNTDLEGKYYFAASSDVKISAIELP
jgi:hypothetical protein